MHGGMSRSRWIELYMVGSWGEWEKNTRSKKVAVARSIHGTPEIAAALCVPGSV